MFSYTRDELKLSEAGRFWYRLSLMTEQRKGCLMLKTHLSARGGLKMHYGGARQSPSRVIFELLVGESLPRDIVVVRKCGEARCVAPEHFTLKAAYGGQKKAVATRLTKLLKKALKAKTYGVEA